MAAEQIRHTAPDALSNLVAVLELAEDGLLRCSAATRRPLASTVKLVEDVLVAGDYYDTGESIAAHAWPLLLQAGGMARLNGSELELTARGRDALARPGYDALGALWARWLKNVSFDELVRIDVIKGQRKPATLTSAARRRGTVVACLAALEPDAWADTEMIWHVLQTDDAPLAVVRNQLALWRLYIGDSYYGSLGHAGPKAWDIVEGRYTLCVLFEYAATAGVIDVTYTDPRGARDDYRFLCGTDDLPFLSRYDGLTAIRVNELGAAILHDPSAVRHLNLPVPRRPRWGGT
ncbi:MAG: hypothetical protein JO345_10005 [Streptosporangiaceae bacterium]|nr:hypothetical protein [Streptosporangiaceae bacterium]